MSKLYALLVIIGLVIIGSTITMGMNPGWYMLGFLLSFSGVIAIFSMKKEVIYVEKSADDIKDKYTSKREDKNYNFSSPDPVDVLSELESIRTKAARRKRASNKGDEGKKDS